MTQREAVTVIGLGPMGQAMVRAFLAAGHPTTVWNRTPAKAEAMAAEGATKADTVAEAVAASELIVLSLPNYAAMYAILTPVADALSGRTIVNLSTDSPAGARAGAEWAETHGARFLVGEFMSPGPDIQHESSRVLYSGSSEVLEAHRATLEVLSPAEYLGGDPRLAKIYDKALLAVVLPAMNGFRHAVAMVERVGIQPREFLPYALDLLKHIANMMTVQAAQIQDGELPSGHLTGLVSRLTDLDHVIEFSREIGLDTTVMDHLRTLIQGTVDAGRAAGEPVSIYDIQTGATR